MLAPFTAVASSTLPVAGNAASVTSNSLTSTPPVAASRYQNMLIAVLLPYSSENCTKFVIVLACGKYWFMCSTMSPSIWYWIDRKSNQPLLTSV